MPPSDSRCNKAMIEVITSVSGQRLLRLYLGFIKIIAIINGFFVVLPLLIKAFVSCSISFFSFSNIECFNNDLFSAIGLFLLFFQYLNCIS